MQNEVPLSKLGRTASKRRSSDPPILTHSDTSLGSCTSEKNWRSNSSGVYRPLERLIDRGPRSARCLACRSRQLNGSTARGLLPERGKRITLGDSEMLVECSLRFLAELRRAMADNEPLGPDDAGRSR